MGSNILILLVFTSKLPPISQVHGRNLLSRAALNSICSSNEPKDHTVGSIIWLIHNKEYKLDCPASNWFPQQLTTFVSLSYSHFFTAALLCNS